MSDNWWGPHGQDWNVNLGGLEPAACEVQKGNSACFLIKQRVIKSEPTIKDDAHEPTINHYYLKF